MVRSPAQRGVSNHGRTRAAAPGPHPSRRSARAGLLRMRITVSTSTRQGRRGGDRVDRIPNQKANAEEAMTTSPATKHSRLRHVLLATVVMAAWPALAAEVTPERIAN